MEGSHRAVMARSAARVERNAYRAAWRVSGTLPPPGNTSSRLEGLGAARLMLHQLGGAVQLSLQDARAALRRVASAITPGTCLQSG